MMKRFPVYGSICVFTIGILLVGCDPDDDVEPAVNDVVPGPVIQLNSFPVEIGNQWNYKMEVEVTGPDPSFGLTESEIRFTVISDTLINGTPAARVRNSKTVNSVQELIGDRYFANTEQGLDILAVKGSSGQMFLRLSEQLSVSTTDLMYLSTEMAATDSVILLDSAIHILKLPTVDGQVWRSNEYGPDFQVKRRYMGYYTVTTEAGTFDCIKLQLFQDQNNDNLPDSGWFDLVQYFSEKGLIKEIQQNELLFGDGETGTFYREARLISVNF